MELYQCKFEALEKPVQYNNIAMKLTLQMWIIQPNTKLHVSMNYSYIFIRLANYIII